MGTFNTNKLLYGNPVLINKIAKEVSGNFTNEGYEVTELSLASGGREIHLTKGGVFKAVLGLKTSLNVSLIPEDDKIRFNAKVGIFGKEIVPALIAYFIAWPVIVPMIWGLVKQSQLDDQVLALVENIIFDDNKKHYNPQATIFCPKDGARIPADSKLCPYCGTPL